MGQITLVRHGQASFGQANYDQLSETGYEQGRALGRWWSDCATRIDRALDGGMRRHAQTAQACLQTLHDELHPDEPLSSDHGFREYDHVEMLIRHEPRMQDPEFMKVHFQHSDHPRRDFQRLFLAAFARWISGDHDADYAETWPDFRNRCIAALERCMAASARSEHIVIFTSGGPIGAICQHLLGLADDRVAELCSAFANGSLTRLLFQPGRLSLNTMNAYPHLERAGRAELVTYR